MSTKPIHQPVMLAEAIEALQVKADCWYLDATFGAGGHSRAILDKGAGVIAMDWDENSIALGKERFAKAIQEQRLILIKDSFANLANAIRPLKIKICGILFDFGTSVDQLTANDRGLSFNHPDAPLDMRLDQSKKLQAKDLLNLLSLQDLTQILSELGGERQAFAIAKKIVAKRKQRAFTKVADLLAVINEVKSKQFGHLHPATKVFQALRIAVNGELENIKQALPQALAVLEPLGRIVTIAFHEGEDRVAKNLFKDWQMAQLGTAMCKKPLTPSTLEIINNPRSRSAKLRIFEKR